MDFFHEAVDSSFFIDYSKLVFGLFRFERDFEEVLYRGFFFFYGESVLIIIENI